MDKNIFILIYFTNIITSYDKFYNNIKIIILNKNISKSEELISYELSTDGFSVLTPQEHNFKDFVTLKKRFSKKTNQELFKNHKIFRTDDLLKSENSDLLSYNNFCKKIIKYLKIGDYYLNTIFQTFDNKESQHLAQNPHLDRLPTLKFMLYLNNLTNENGAFCLSPGSNHWTTQQFKSNRKSFSDKEFLEETRNIPKPILDRMISVEGAAGTIIIFNTDCVHHQGIVKSGEACIIRSHYRKKKLSQGFLVRKKSALKNFARKIYSR